MSNGTPQNTYYGDELATEILSEQRKMYWVCLMDFPADFRMVAGLFASNRLVDILYDITLS